MHFKKLKQSLIEARPGYQHMTTETVTSEQFLELCRRERAGEIVLGPSVAVVGASQYKVSWRRVS